PDSGQALSEYGIFGFLADSPIFNIEKPKLAEVETVVTEQPEEEEPQPVERPCVNAPERVKNPLYDAIYIFGLRIIRSIRFIGYRLKSVLKRPLHALGIFAGIFFVFCDAVLLRSAKATVEEFRKLKAEFQKARHGIKGTLRGSAKDRIKNLPAYLKASYKRHPHPYKTAINIVLPTLSLLLLIGTVSSWTSSTYALEVIVENDGESCSLGYISDESIFIQARTIVKNRIDSGAGDGTLIANPTYRITRVKLNELSDANAISDKIIENSDSKLTSACGVYIDGEFICAIKNETDARSVFDNILHKAEEKYKLDTTDENSFADFVEDIEFVQGLYSDDEDNIWEASKLLHILENEKKSEAVFYSIQKGDTPSGIADKFSVSTSELRALNPSVNFNVFKVGTELMISSEVSFVRVKIIKVIEKNESIPYETEKVESSKLFKGDKRVIRKGVDGTDKVTYLVTYVDGIQTESEEIGRVTIVEPISEKIQIGTKKPTIYGNGSSVIGNYEIISKGRFVWPVSGLYTLTSQYGRRRSGFHTGLDIAGGNASGKLVLAADSGTVELVKFSNRSYGNQVVINHGNGVKTRYAHMLDGSISVSVGQKVSRGQAIGRVGNTGNSSGAHLHFEVIVNGNTVNPLPYIK
ncbi:MAG: M23 family metallopeptidase, partial [Clostridia bacterium]|nr:M23 family metallopeptidase [Clostridia bacterium]